PPPPPPRVARGLIPDPPGPDHAGGPVREELGPAAGQRVRAGRGEVHMRLPVIDGVAAADVAGGDSGRDAPRHRRVPLAPPRSVMPDTAAPAISESLDSRPCAVHESSDCPQLIEIAIGAGVACAASEIASMKPLSLFGAK